MKISIKLTILSVMIILLVIFIGVFSFNITKDIALTYTGLSEEFYEDVDAAIEVQSYSKRAEGHLFLYLTLHNDMDKEKFFKRYKSLNDQIAILKRVVTTHAGKKQLKTLETVSKIILKTGTKLVEIHDAAPGEFVLKDHEKLFIEFQNATSEARRTGVAIAKRRTMDAAVEASSFAKRAEGHLSIYLTFDSEMDKEKFFKRHHSLKDQIEILSVALTMPEQLEYLKKLRSASETILRVGTKLMDLHDADPEGFVLKDHEKLFIEFHDATSGARSTGVKLAKMEATALRRRVEDGKDRIGKHLHRIIIAIVFIIILSIGLFIFASISILRPIQELKNAAIEISRGNLEKKVKASSANDEIGMLGDAFNDMTHQLKMTQNKLLRHERLSALGQLAGSIGHELRNPLNIIGNAAFIVNMKLENPSEDVKKYLEILQTEVERANTIISNILNFSRMSVVTPIKSNVNEIIQDTIERLVIPENISLELDLMEDIPLIELDTAQIQQVFMNIVINAIQALPEGGSIMIQTKVEDGLVEIKFVDTGEGIKNEQIGQIFEPLYSTKIKGIGLGLAIVKVIIEKHHGDIDVESEVGKGTTFTVHFPLERKKENE